MDKFWYRYIYPKNLVLFDNEKLIAPEISKGGNFTYDKKGEFYSTTKNYGYILNGEVNESYLFWLGLLNSQLFWFFIKNTGYVLRGGYYTFKTNYITPFPIPASIPFPISKQIENLVNQILSIKEVAPKSCTMEQEKLIDILIYELYNLTTDDIKVIEYTE